MATTTETVLVKITAGVLGGAKEQGIAVFRGVPYAAAPVGDLRFSPPQPAAAWEGVRYATKDGPIAPQGRSRLAHSMGDFERPESGDWLTLTMCTPARAPATRPEPAWSPGWRVS